MNVTFHTELFSNTILDSNTFKILHGIASIFVIAIAFISYLGFIMLRKSTIAAYVAMAIGIYKS